MAIARWLGERFVVPVVHGSRFLQDLSAFVADQVGPNGYGTLKRRFIENGRHSKWDTALRRKIVDRFERIHARVPVHSTRADGLILAEAALSCCASGDLVECGCFAGGSTSKLSIVAGILGRRLYVFDSFEGLPPPRAAETVDYHARRSNVFQWKAGDCSAALQAVRTAVETYGDPTVCEFIPGWFKDTLTAGNLPDQLAFAYADVVLPSSAAECLTSIWPLLTPGGVFFSRDVGSTNVLQALCDDRVWSEVMREPRPILFGAGFGMRDASPNLGVMVKGKDLTASYIDSLMIDKVSPGDQPGRS